MEDRSRPRIDPVNVLVHLVIDAAPVQFTLRPSEQEGRQLDQDKEKERRHQCASGAADDRPIQSFRYEDALVGLSEF